MRRMLRRTSARLAIVAAAALVASGGALAYFSAAGGGDGSASVGTPAALTISAGTPTAGLLYPGGTGELDATVSNPNGFQARVNSLVLGGAGIAVDGGHSGCDTSALHYTSQDNGGAGWDVPARAGAIDGRLDVQLPGAISMDAAAANACQGATITVSLATGP